MMAKDIPNQMFLAFDETLGMYDMRFEDLDGTTYKLSTPVTEFINGLLTTGDNSTEYSIDTPDYFGNELTPFTKLDTAIGSSLLDRIGNRIRSGNFSQVVRNEILYLAAQYSDHMEVTNINIRTVNSSGKIEILLSLRDLATNQEMRFTL